MTMNNLESLWEIETRNRHHYVSASPELSHSTAYFNYATFEKGVGITNIPQGRTQACWPLVLADYCIEEHLMNGLIAYTDKRLSSSDPGDFLLLQVISSAGTAAIINHFKQALALELAEIGYASNKEVGLVGSQFISLPAAKAGNLASLVLPNNMIIAGSCHSQNPITAQSLKGNSYTLLLRTEEVLDNDRFGLKIENLGKYGVLNYFPPKRFGRRHLSHLFGKLLLSEKYEEAVKYFLCQTSPTEELLVSRLREVAAKSFPNHEKLEKIFSVLPATFASELAVIRYLQGQQSDFAGAIIQIKSLARQWLFAYGAYIFNGHLSEVSVTKGITQEGLPWTFSPDTSDKLVYRRYFERDGIFNGFEVDFIKELIPVRKQILPGRIFPKSTSYRAFDGGVALSFFLEGNQAAETVVANLFNITDAVPPPAWANAAPHDAKQILGQGSLTNLVQKLSQTNA
jgi:hypothetical protein